MNTGSRTDCDCPTGARWNSGTLSCNCPAYRAGTPDQQCDVGFESTRAITSVACATGYTNAAGDVVAGSGVTDTQCDLCAANYRVSSSNTCVACPGSSTNVAGDDSTGSATACDCPTGYQWNTGTNQCDTCAANYHVSSGACVACTSGLLETPRFHHWWRHEALLGRAMRDTMCLRACACSARLVKVERLVMPCSAATRRATCARQTTAPQVGRHVAVEHANAALDSKSSLTTCDLCAADYYVASISTCTACPTGTTNVAGDVNTGSVTDCDCPTGSSWNAARRRDCPSNSAWDSVGGQCECDAGFRVDSSNNECVACATGYTNAAGDVVAGSGVNTQCDVRANYRVLGRVRGVRDRLLERRR